MSMSELSSEVQNFEDDYPYATRGQAFYDQTIFGFVMDEVHAMMQIMFCEIRGCANFYNPLYLIIFCILYIVTIPGAAMHWTCLSCLPVRNREFPEEREFRSQGIYTAVGIAMINIPFAIIGLFIGNDELLMINEVSIVVNVCIIISNLIALRAITDELLLSTRTFIVGVWLIDAILIGLTLFDVYTFVSFSWATIAEFVLRIFEIIVYTIIGVQSIQFWDMYVEEANTRVFAKDNTKDVVLCIILTLMIVIVFSGFIFAISISEENSWRIMYW